MKQPKKGYQETHILFVNRVRGWLSFFGAFTLACSTSVAMPTTNQFAHSATSHATYVLEQAIVLLKMGSAANAEQALADCNEVGLQLRSATNVALRSVAVFRGGR